MCVIIVKQNNNRLPAEVAKTSASINPHGLGVVWLDTYEITYHKSSEYSVLHTNRPFIAHFRYATVGKVNLENTHPFRCGNHKHEFLMMNGTIRGLGNLEECDTKVLARNLGNIDRHKWKDELSKHPHRFVSVNVRNRTFQIYNRHLFTYKDGVWYSKDNVLQENLVAVYGTLKKGNSNYFAYLMDSKMVGSGVTKDRYPMLIQGLPYLVEKKGVGHNVNVDVFKVSDSVLKDLDKLEGHPNWYVRKQVPIMMDKTGKELMCWIYFNPKQIKDGDVFHKSFNPQVKSIYSRKPSFSSYVIQPDIEFEQDEFDLERESPICIDCYHDLEHDGFANYYCQSCGAWFAEDEVGTFLP